MSNLNKVQAPRANADALRERLMAKIRIDDATQCWNWTGAKSKGYGVMSSSFGKAPYKAHRLSYELHVGRIPDRMVLRHACDNPSCCNPSHLIPGTQRDNMRDASSRGRLNPKSLANLYPGAKGVHGAAVPKGVNHVIA